MEKYAGSCRLILCSNSVSKVIPAIRSRCLNIRVPAPTEEEARILHLIYITKLSESNVLLFVGDKNCDERLSGRTRNDPSGTSKENSHAKWTESQKGHSHGGSH